MASYEITEGEIIYMGQSILEMSPEEKDLFGNFHELSISS